MVSLLIRTALSEFSVNYFMKQLTTMRAKEKCSRNTVSCYIYLLCTVTCYIDFVVSHHIVPTMDFRLGSFKVTIRKFCIVRISDTAISETCDLESHQS